MRVLATIPICAAILWGLTACCCLPRVRVPAPVVVNLPPPPIVIEQPPPPPPPKAVAPPGVPGKRTIDLIPLVVVGIDSVDQRRWEVRGTDLHCHDGSFVPRLMLPYGPPPEYDFTVVYSQPNLRNGISMIMPNPSGGSFYWFLGPNNLDFGFGSNLKIEGRLQAPIQPNTPVTTKVEVRKDGVKGFVNGQLLIHHPSASFKELNSDTWREIPDKSRLAVACDDPTVFHFIRVVEISGKGKLGRLVKD